MEDWLYELEQKCAQCEAPLKRNNRLGVTYCTAHGFEYLAKKGTATVERILSALQEPYGYGRSETLVTKDMGGQVAELASKWVGRWVQCYGGGCQKRPVRIDQIMAYAHNGGVVDRNGKPWWVFFRCPKCHYATSSTKFENRSGLVKREYE